MQIRSVGFSTQSAIIRHACGAITLGILCSCLLFSSAIAKPNLQAALRSRVQALLDAYQRNDSEAVLSMVDVQGFSMYGSDASELISTPAELKTMMINDFKLWHTAKFGSIRDASINVHGNCGSMFFQVPFSAGGSADVVVRFATVWRFKNGVWLLTMSSNTVPTTGSSAIDLLKGAPP